MKTSRQGAGFTIVELLIVIVVIAILAAITIVAYNGITRQATESSMKSDLHSAATSVGADNTVNGSYPASASAANNGQGLKSSPGTTMSYVLTSTGYCISVSNPKTPSVYSITEQGSISSASCPAPIADGSFMQNIGNVNCPTTRIRAVDARDNRTYWVQKLADGKCWMLTNLAYGGGGTNTYGDVRTLTNGGGGGATQGAPRYYIPTGANPTTEPTAPSLSSDGGATNTQYGYLYNWCGLMGGQATTACANANGLPANTTISVCPAGWRPPTAGAGGELATLNSTVNGGSTTTDAGLRSAWLAQLNGYWSIAFNSQGTRGYYWSSTQGAPDVNGNPRTYAMYLDSATFSIATSFNLDLGAAVRCIVN